MGESHTDADFHQVQLRVIEELHRAGRPVLIGLGDLLLTLDGTPITDKEVLNRLVAGKRWGDSAIFTVKRGEETRTLTVSFRRQPPK